MAVAKPDVEPDEEITFEQLEVKHAIQHFLPGPTRSTPPDVGLLPYTTLSQNWNCSKFNRLYKLKFGSSLGKFVHRHLTTVVLITRGQWHSWTWVLAIAAVRHGS